MLTLRIATMDDAASILAVMERYKQTYLDDYHEVTLDTALEPIQANQMIAIELSGCVVGAFWLTDWADDDLHCQLHLLIDKPFVRRALKEDLFEQVTAFVFKNSNVVKIKALAMEHMDTAIKLLKRTGFKQNGLFRNETKVDGKLRDVFAFELHKRYWSKRHGNGQREKGLEKGQQPVREASTAGVAA